MVPSETRSTGVVNLPHGSEWNVGHRRREPSAWYRVQRGAPASWTFRMVPS